jgi:nitronate monooxygenase
MSLMQRLGLSTPIIQAPMAGGFTPPALVAAVSAAGGLGSFGAAYLTPEAIAATAADIRGRTDRPFGINLFIHPDVPDDPAALAVAAAALEPARRAAGLSAPAEAPPRVPLARQVEAALAARPAMLSTTFGVPDAGMVAACRVAGVLLAGTATTPEEGRALEAAGVDAVVAQGGEAGGHRGTFLGRWEDGLIGTLPLVSMLAAELRVPIVAAGGIMTGAAIGAVLAAGAELAQLGTAFLLCPEAGTSAPHRRAIREGGRPTLVTPVYTGRAARGIANRFAAEMAPLAGRTPPFDAMNALTRDLRRAATERGDTEWMSLWAGQAYPLARPLPAAELVERLTAELGAPAGRR